MGGDDLFVLVLTVGFAALSVLALRGQRGSTSSAPTPDDQTDADRAADRDVRQ